jgi:hypothetical protein
MLLISDICLHDHEFTSRTILCLPHGLDVKLLVDVAADRFFIDCQLLLPLPFFPPLSVLAAATS